MTAVRARGGYPTLTALYKECVSECEVNEVSEIAGSKRRTILGRWWDFGYGEYGLEEILHCRRLCVELYS
jgi:hypothetical protein